MQMPGVTFSGQWAGLTFSGPQCLSGTEPRLGPSSLTSGLGANAI